MGKKRPRERRAIAAVACPDCGAPRGQTCYLRSDAERAAARGRLFIHGARRSAWQDWRNARPVDVLVHRPLPEQPRHGGRLRPLTDAGLGALAAMRQAERDGEWFLVPDLRHAIDALDAMAIVVADEGNIRGQDTRR